MHLEFTGGLRDAGEAPAIMAARELREETDSSVGNDPSHRMLCRRRTSVQRKQFSDPTALTA